MQLPTIKEMIQAGAHFGHKKDKTNPKAAKKYGFGIKDGIYIIDLDKTQVMLKQAMDYIAQCIKKNQTILFQVPVLSNNLVNLSIEFHSSTG